MRKNRQPDIWVTVLVRRGFVSEILASRQKTIACKKYTAWRRRINPDYDEVAICPVRIQSRRRPRATRLTGT